MLQSKGKQFAKVALDFKAQALTDEVVLASVQIGLGNYLLTNFRFVLMAVMGGIKSSYPIVEIESFRSEPAKLGRVFFIVLHGNSEQKIGLLFDEIADEFFGLFEEVMATSAVSPDLRVESAEASIERYSKVPSNRTKTKFPSHLAKAIQKNAKTGEDPIMIISGQSDSTEGSLIVFSDRCVISKSGLLAGFMAGSLGGSRDAAFYLKDITGIEYNSGLLNGVLEILTASYDGSQTKDFWSGMLNADRNKSQNDPRVLSNTLPLTKGDYQSAKPLIDKLRTMIQQAKETNVVVNVTSSNVSSTADELGKLADLLDRGLITLDEFQVAKERLLK